MKKKKAENPELPFLYEKPTFKQRMKKFGRNCWRQKELILLAIIPVGFMLVFCYGPMYGIQIAFKDYSPKLGITGSPWEEPLLRNFTRFFKNVNSWRYIWNTLRIGIWTTICTFPAPILFALFFNELHGKIFKRTVQTISYLPHFISVVVICSMLNGFGSLDGLFNQIRGFFGLAAVNMNAGSTYFLPMYVGSAVWQGVGWGSIIYLSALSNVDTSLYDVANIDGANRFQKMRHIAWQAIKPTTTILLIMNMGGVINTSYTKILLMQNDTNLSVTETIQTYVYSTGIEGGNYEYATAINLLLSVVSFILVFGTNMIVRKIEPENSMF